MRPRFDRLSPTGRGVRTSAMRVFKSIFGLMLTLAAAAPAMAVSDSADAPHVHVQFIVPASTFNSRAGGGRRALFQNRPRLAHLLEERRRRGRASAAEVDAAGRHFGRTAGVSGAKAAAAGAVDGLRLRKTKCFSPSISRLRRRQNPAGPFCTPKSPGWFARRAAFPERLSSKSPAE